MKYRDIIENALQNHGADYCEIRIEETDNTRLTYRGDSLDSIGQTSGLGGNVRAATRGGWGFASFNSLDELRSKVTDATTQSRAVGDSKTELRSEEHTSELQSLVNLVCRLLLEKKNQKLFFEKLDIIK